MDIYNVVHFKVKHIQANFANTKIVMMTQAILHIMSSNVVVAEHHPSNFAHSFIYKSQRVYLSGGKSLLMDGF